MPVPSTIADLSLTANDNSPAGTDVPNTNTGPDDYIRAHAAIIKKLAADSGADLAKTDGNFIVGDGTNWVAESGATARASLGLTIGTHVQAYDATLTALGGTLTAANKIPYATALNTAAELDFKDEDNMASNSATALPSQQSVKAYVDAEVSGSIALGTAATASGTAVDFIGIASTAQRITILMSALSTNGTSLPIVQLGDSGGFETSGYMGTSGLVQNAGTSATAAMSSGFIFVPSIADITVVQGRVVLEKINGNVWIATSVMASSNVAVPMFSAGVKTLTGTLTQVRITTTNGTDAFDAGTINVIVE